MSDALIIPITVKLDAAQARAGAASFGQSVAQAGQQSRTTTGLVDQYGNALRQTGTDAKAAAADVDKATRSKRENADAARANSAALRSGRGSWIAWAQAANDAQQFGQGWRQGLIATSNQLPQLIELTLSSVIANRANAASLQTSAVAGTAAGAGLATAGAGAAAAGTGLRLLSASMGPLIFIFSALSTAAVLFSNDSKKVENALDRQAQKAREARRELAALRGAQLGQRLFELDQERQRLEAERDGYTRAKGELSAGGRGTFTTTTQTADGEFSVTRTTQAYDAAVAGEKRVNRELAENTRLRAQAASQSADDLLARRSYLEQENELLRGRAQMTAAEQAQAARNQAEIDRITRTVEARDPALNKGERAAAAAERRADAEATRLQNEARQRALELARATADATADGLARNAATEAAQARARIAQIDDERERRRQSIEASFRASKAAAVAQRDGEILRIRASGETEAVQQQQIAQARGRYRAEVDQAIAARVEALAEFERTSAEKAAEARREQAERVASFQLAQGKALLAEEANRRAAARAGITDEAARRRQEITDRYELAVAQAEFVEGAEVARIKNTTKDGKEAAYQIKVARLATVTAVAEADGARIDATLTEEQRAARAAAEHRRSLARSLARGLERGANAIRDELERRRQITDADVELAKLGFEEQEKALKKSLAEREITEREYHARMAKLAEDRAQFEKDVERDRSSFVSRSWDKLADFIIDQMIRVAVKQAALGVLRLLGDAATGGTGGFFVGLLKGLAGGSFASGGYTGPGGKYDPAGVVHRGEFVMPAHVVRRDGPRAWMGLLGMMERGLTLTDLLGIGGLPGYADGGYVAGMIGVPPIAAAAARTSVYDDRNLVAATERQTFETKQMRAEMARLQDVARQAPLSPRAERRRVLLAQQEQQRLDPTTRR